MIVFLTSVRHPHNCNSYNYILRLLEKTLRSVCNQSNQYFKVIVVCNSNTDMKFKHANLEYVVVDFPPPSADRTPNTGLDTVRKDKGAKYVIGLSVAKKYNPDYVMFFDADDFISKNLSEFCNNNLKQNGWFIKYGYIYKDGGILCEKTKDFNKICGTSNILNFNLLKIPDFLNPASSIDRVIDSVDNYFLTHILASHPFTVNYFSLKGL